MRTSLLLADHNRLLRQGLRAMLKTDGEFEVVAEAHNADEAVRIAITHAPDLVLIDSGLPGLHDTEAIARIKRRMPYVRIVMLGSAPDAMPESLGAGVDARVLKDASFQDFLETLRSVGASNESPAKDQSTRPAGARDRHGADVAAPPLSRLTLRERSILQLIAEGHTNRATASQLSVSQKTVEKHRANLMRKLGVHNATELMFAAVGLGIVDSPMPHPRAIPARQFEPYGASG